MTHEKITVAESDGLVTIAFNKPDRLNALCTELLSEFSDALSAIAKPDSGARCLMLTGTGRGFSAGADLSASDPAARDSRAMLERHYHPVLLKLRDLEMPIVTAVNGIAAGAGMSFALMGDYIVMAESGYFLQAFRRIGLVPDAGSTFMLPRLIGRARAMELSLLGEKLPAATALDWGLINRVLPDAGFHEAATAIARDLADGPTRALALTRRLYLDSATNSFDEQLAAEARAQGIASATADAREGITAFLEKRAANFEGR